MSFNSTKLIELGSCCFRQPNADSHCKYLHGYNLTARFYFIANSLDDNNWVVDFGGFKGLKEELKRTFDHKTVISKKDPFLYKMKELAGLGIVDLVEMEDISIEMFAKHCLNIANNYIDIERVRCYKVEVFEHDRNSGVAEIRD